MAHDDDVVVDEEVREQLNSVVVCKKLGLLRLNTSLGHSHTLKTKQIDGTHPRDQ